jgi:hypothetical protein
MDVPTAQTRCVSPTAVPLIYRPSAAATPMVVRSLPSAVVIAGQIYWAFRTIQDAAEGDWASAALVGVGVAASILVLMAHRRWYLRNVSLRLDEQRVRWTTPVGTHRDCPRAQVAHVSVMQGNTRSFISPPASLRIVLRDADYRRLLRASVRYFAEG